MTTREYVLAVPEQVQLSSGGNNMIQYRILILLILWCCSIARTQVTEEWVRRYDGTGGGTDEAHSIAVDGAGNVYITGISSGGVYSDYATMKYNTSGVQQWVARYNGPGGGNDGATSIAVDGQGNVYVTGWSNPIQFGQNYDYATIKYNSLGVQQWVARYNGPDNQQDRALSLALDGQGNVYVTGESYSIATTYDYATIKYNSGGVQQWVRRYSGPPGSVFFDQASSIALDGQGNVYVTGQSAGAGTGSDYATIKYDASGTEQWVMRYDRLNVSSQNENATSIAVDGLGNVHVTGASGSGGRASYATVKYNSSGVEQWVGIYTADTVTFQSIANAIAVDNSGNVYVTGVSRVTMPDTQDDFATVKYDPNGNQLWVQRYNGPGSVHDNPHSIVVDGQGNVYVTGESWGSGTLYDCATIKYNPAGVQQWIQRYNGPGNGSDYGYSVAVDAQGSVYVTGSSAQSGINFDYVTIKYSQPTGISHQPDAIPYHFVLHQNYPNPFNPTTTISYSVPAGTIHESIVRLVVYDVLGSIVATLVNEEKQPGLHNVKWDASTVASGVYFYRLSTPDFVQTRKFVLLR